MATTYIIYSESIDKYHIGSCKDFSERINQHNNHTFGKSIPFLIRPSYKR